jgi:putative phosphoesterase
MKIGLMSDTHGYLDQKIYSYFNDCDEIWHAGDIGNLSLLEELRNFKKVRAVYGNIDGNDLRTTLPQELIFDVEGVLVWMIHIGGYPPVYTSIIKKSIKKIMPDLLVCGHSHILRVMTDPNFSNLLYLNPGAAGKEGFHKIRTIIRFSIEGKRITNLQAIELGSRG